MKALTITEEQKVRLLKMCKALFPNNQWSFDNDFSDEGILDCDIDLIKPHFKLFHWFEFVTTMLAKKILTPEEDEENYLEFLEQVFMYNENPIDFLYWYIENNK
jgi:hypothetical protein